jgi:hypothetical protein
MPPIHLKRSEEVKKWEVKKWEVKKWEVKKWEVRSWKWKFQITSYQFRITNAIICTFQSATIYVNLSIFSRRSTLIFFSLIQADLFSAPICVNYFSDLFLSQINADLFLADLRRFFFCAHLRFQFANICVK